MKNRLLNLLSVLILSCISIFVGFSLAYAHNDNQGKKEVQTVTSLEEQAKEAWINGCVPHLVEEAQKLTDVVNEEAAAARAQIYCQCDWDYMRENMGLSLDEIATMQQQDSVGFKAIAEAQDFCYEKHKGDYYP